MLFVTKFTLIHVLAHLMLALSLIVLGNAQEAPKFKEVRPPDVAPAPSKSEGRPPDVAPAPSESEGRPPDAAPPPNESDVRRPDAAPAPSEKQIRPSEVLPPNAASAPKEQNVPNLNAGPRSEIRSPNDAPAPKEQDVRSPNAEWFSSFRGGRKAISLVQLILSTKELLSILIAAIVSIAVIIVSKILIPNDRVKWTVTRQHAFLINSNLPQTTPAQVPGNPEQTEQPKPRRSALLYTRSIWVQNFGRDHIKEVEIILRDPPHHFEVWPQRQYIVATNVQRNLIIRFESLRPRENITLAILNAGVELPQVQSVKWNGGVAREVPMIPQEELSYWAMQSIRGLMLSGILFWAYVLIRLVFAAFE